MAAGAIGQDVVLILIGLQLVKALGVLVPPAFFFTTLWVLGRMYRDSEMVALQAAGVGIGRIYRSVLIAAIPLAFVATYWGLSVVPWAKGEMESIKKEQESSAAIANFTAGEFEEFRDGELVVYTETRDPKTGYLQGVFIQNRQHGRLGIITAEHAYQVVDERTGDDFIILADGQRYTGTAGSPEFTVDIFKEYGILLTKEAVVVTDPNDIISAKPWLLLLASDKIVDHAEFQARIMGGLAVIVFAIAAVPLARTRPRQGVYGRLSAAILLYFVFMNLQRLAERWMIKGDAPEWLGIWWVALLIVLLAGAIIALDSHKLHVGLQRLRRG